MAMPAGPKKHITLMGGGINAVSNKATEKQIDGALKWVETTKSPFLTDEVKINIEDEINQNLEKGMLITVKEMSVWNENSETLQYKNKLIDEKANGNLNHVKLYNDFVADLGDCELRPEEPVCAQELYAILDSCIQAVLTDKNADCAELIRKACSDFQVNYLDNLDY